mmetsp:Transcript_87098/g.208348  ORF Transcript_87098/g.208348 Transcript_87098/m.208348 type:complete len:511 (+) Transcript_87098:60-1592(+)
MRRGQPWTNSNCGLDASEPSLRLPAAHFATNGLNFLEELGILVVEDHHVQGPGLSLDLHEALAELRNGDQPITIIQDVKQWPNVLDADVQVVQVLLHAGEVHGLEELVRGQGPVSIFICSPEELLQLPLEALRLPALALYSNVRVVGGACQGLFQEQRGNDTNHCEHHQRDIAQEEECIPRTHLLHHRPHAQRPAAAVCHLEHRVQGLDKAAIETVHLQSSFQVSTLVGDVALERLADGQRKAQLQQQQQHHGPAQGPNGGHAAPNQDTKLPEDTHCLHHPQGSRDADQLDDSDASARALSAVGEHGEDEELSGTDEDQDRIEEVHEHQAFEMVIGPLGSQDHHPDQHVNHIDTEEDDFNDVENLGGPGGSLTRDAQVIVQGVPCQLCHGNHEGQVDANDDAHVDVQGPLDEGNDWGLRMRYLAHERLGKAGGAARQGLLRGRIFWLNRRGLLHLPLSQGGEGCAVHLLNVLLLDQLVHELKEDLLLLSKLPVQGLLNPAPLLLPELGLL